MTRFLALLGMNLTELWMLFGVGVVSGLLELAALRWGWTPVITRSMRANGQLWTLWPFLWGFIGGHIWSPTWFKVVALQRAQPFTIPVILAGVLLFDVLVRRTSVETAFLVLVGAMLVGATFWNTAP